MYYLEYCLEKNEELEENCEYEYYVLHYKNNNPFEDSHVYCENGYIILKVFELK